MIKIAALYIAVVVGAGFASGQEIYQFFVQFGVGGLFGLIIATFVLSLGGASLIAYCAQNQLSSYEGFLKRLGGSLFPYLDLVYSVFLIAGLSIMIAGSESLISTISLPQLGRIFTIVTVLLVLRGGAKAVLDASSVLVPILLLLMVLVTVLPITQKEIILPTKLDLRGIGAGLLYGSYNIGFGLAVFSGIGRELAVQKRSWLAGIIGGTVLGILVALQTIALYSISPELRTTDLPILTLARQQHQIIGALYGIALWFAMYTTALGNGLALATRIKDQTTLSWRASVNVTCILGLTFSFFGFVPLIRTAYPLFGFFGIYILSKIWMERFS